MADDDQDEHSDAERLDTLTLLTLRLLEQGRELAPRVEALTDALVAKGLITSDEFAAALHAAQQRALAKAGSPDPGDLVERLRRRPGPRKPQ